MTGVIAAGNADNSLGLRFYLLFRLKQLFGPISSWTFAREAVTYKYYLFWRLHKVDHESMHKLPDMEFGQLPCVTVAFTHQASAAGTCSNLIQGHQLEFE